ncbi:MAG: hypothetical protein AAF403_07700, partial [Pseudomonadota bacterium]
KLPTSLMNTGTSDGDIPLISTGDKLNASIIPTGTNAGDIVKVEVGDKIASSLLPSSALSSVDITARSMALHAHIINDTQLNSVIAQSGYFTDKTDRGVTHGSGASINYQSLTLQTNSTQAAGYSALSRANDGVTQASVGGDAYFGQAGSVAVNDLYMGYDFGVAKAVLTSVNLITYWNASHTVFAGNTSLGHATDRTSLGNITSPIGGAGGSLTITTTTPYRYLWIGSAASAQTLSGTYTVYFYMVEFSVTATTPMASAGSYTSNTLTIPTGKTRAYFWLRLNTPSQWGTDLTMQASIDNGTTYANASNYRQIGSNICLCEVDVSAQTGTQLKYKVANTATSSGYTWLGGAID